METAVEALGWVGGGGLGPGDDVPAEGAVVAEEGGDAAAVAELHQQAQAVLPPLGRPVAGATPRDTHSGNNKNITNRMYNKNIIKRSIKNKYAEIPPLGRPQPAGCRLV